MNMKKLKSGLWRGLAITLALVFLAASTSSEDFLQQRRDFREKIEDKRETALDDKELYWSVTFKGEKDYNFKMDEELRQRLVSYTSEYFNTDNQKLLGKMADKMQEGRYIIYKDYQEDGVNLKTLFLSPEAKYWEWLTDGDGIEQMFHVYNFSVGLGGPDRNTEYVIIQTEGSFWGITQQVTLPVKFIADANERTYSFHMPTQKEITDWVEKMPALKTGRTSPEEKYIDYCREHPFFQMKDDDGNYEIEDDQIIEYYETTVTDLDEECPVKEMSGHWRIQEGLPWLLVDYSLKTRVNMDAFIPRSLRFMSGALENVAQKISDEVSVKYLPLSMKNFRDHTQEWTRTGVPE